jgi:glucose-6-phosphate 1-epimerase
VTGTTAILTGAGGLPYVSLRAEDGAAADVYLHGAHVTSWRPAPDGDERLFLSARSEFRHGAAIRGGIPVIFPQFAAEGPLPRHGFARTLEWTLDGVEHGENDAVATFSFRPTPAVHALWPSEFLATLDVRVGGSRLLVTLGVENVGASPFSFTCALHTYLRVRDAAQAELVGLKGARFRDAHDTTKLRLDDEPVLRVTGELDRVYVGAPPSLILREPKRALRIGTRDFPDVVVWNPGRRRAAALADMEPNGERSMLCVEAAVVQMPITLASGGHWRGSQVLDVAVHP